MLARKLESAMRSSEVADRVPQDQASIVLTHQPIDDQFPSRLADMLIHGLQAQTRAAHRLTLRDRALAVRPRTAATDTATGTRCEGALIHRLAVGAES